MNLETTVLIVRMWKKMERCVVKLDLKMANRLRYVFFVDMSTAVAMPYALISPHQFCVAGGVLLSDNSKAEGVACHQAISQVDWARKWSTAQFATRYWCVRHTSLAWTCGHGIAPNTTDTAAILSRCDTCVCRGQLQLETSGIHDPESTPRIAGKSCQYNAVHVNSGYHEKRPKEVLWLRRSIWIERTLRNRFIYFYILIMHVPFFLLIHLLLFCRCQRG